LLVWVDISSALLYFFDTIRYEFWALPNRLVSNILTKVFKSYYTCTLYPNFRKCFVFEAVADSTSWLALTNTGKMSSRGPPLREAIDKYDINQYLFFCFTPWRPLSVCRLCKDCGAAGKLQEIQKFINIYGAAALNSTSSVSNPVVWGQ